MKGMKKLLSILMVLTLVLSLGVSALADGGAAKNKATVTIDDAADKQNHTYKAYQIFTGDSQSADGAIGNLTWGDGIEATAFVDELVSENIISGVTKKGEEYDAQEVAKAISAITDKTKQEQLAKIALKHKVAAKGIELNPAGTEMDIGYYVIEDTTNVAGEDMVKNEVILQLTNDIHVEFKTDKPSSDKQVKDINDTETTTETGWQESADWDIGDMVPFKLTATIPFDTTDTYKTYKLVFHDHEKKGLKFDKDTVEVFVNGNKISSGYEILTAGMDGKTDDCTFDILITDVKTLEHFDATNGEGNVITVEYKSELTTDAVIGREGNPNTMHIEFSNDSMSEGTGETPDDTVIVFTYDMDVNKIDGTSKEALEGADFALYKKVAEGYKPAAGKEIVYVNTKTGEVKNTKPEGDATDWAACVEVTLEKSNPGHPENEADEKYTKFYGKGIDDGDYIIVETATPAGYNSIAPKEFSITAEHTQDDDPVLESVTDAKGQFTFTLTPADENTPMASTNVENEKGPVLPETGGIGTTIFYIAGAVLVIGAMILLVTKKRVSGMEK